MPSRPDVLRPNELLSAVLSASHDMIVVVDDDGRIRQANDEARRRLTSIPAGSRVGSAFGLIHPDDRRGVSDRLAAALAPDRCSELEIDPLPVRVAGGDGVWITVEASGFTPIGAPDDPGVVVVVRDPTTSADDRAHRTVSRGVPDRRVVDRLAMPARRVDESNSPAFVVMVRLDELEGLRETHGIGGATAIAQRMSAAVHDRVRAGWAVVEDGPGEIVVVTEPGAEPVAVDEFARELLDVAHAPASSEGPVDHDLAIGVATLRPGGDVASVLAEASAAATAAGALAIPAPVFFDENLRNDVGDRRRAIAEVERALADGELTVHYQPILDVRTERVHGFEGLLRWNHPVVGLISAGEFLPDVEGTTVMADIGAFVLETGCRQLAAWQAVHGPRAPFLSVNVSARQLREGGFASLVRRQLDRSGADAPGLCLELTETHAIEWESAAFAELCTIRELGVRLALDDFGTGYSSLHHLDRIGADVLKIDRSFIARLDRDPGASAVVKASIELGAAFGMETVAEGVTTAAQRDLLRALGCDHVQGYLVAPAVGVEVADAMLRDDAAGGTRTDVPSRAEVRVRSTDAADSLVRIADARIQLSSIDADYRPSVTEIAALAGVAPALVGRTLEAGDAGPIGALLAGAG